MIKPFFKQEENYPKPLKDIVSRKVRFDELDPLNIMWHGNYASFFEEGRVALGEKYGIGYLDFFKFGVSIPLKKFFAEFIAPLEFGKTYQIETFLYWNEAARLDFSYNIKDGAILNTAGYSVHLMISKEKGILTAKPPFFEDFCRAWKEGKFDV
ncbi:MAG: acyl-CoA thioesterase [Elusimicrobiota bacterium]|jgi:acyl-CoA thioester hydrolase|nr:acyl-CoA thioesterase [Elusimicrobiota bacterium]